jgi:hypothetical protein
MNWLNWRNPDQHLLALKSINKALAKKQKNIAVTKTKN